MAYTLWQEVRKGFAMGAKSVSRKVFYILAAIAVVLTASLLWGGAQAYAAGKSVEPTDISSGYRLGFSKTATFTGFPYGKDFVEGGVQLFKEGSTEPVSGFTYEVKSCGENIDAGTGAAPTPSREPATTRAS